MYITSALVMYCCWSSLLCPTDVGNDMLPDLFRLDRFFSFNFAVIKLPPPNVKNKKWKKTKTSWKLILHYIYIVFSSVARNFLVHEIKFNCPLQESNILNSSFQATLFYWTTKKCKSALTKVAFYMIPTLLLWLLYKLASVNFKNIYFIMFTIIHNWQYYY